EGSRSPGPGRREARTPLALLHRVPADGTAHTYASRLIGEPRRRRPVVLGSHLALPLSPTVSDHLGSELGRVVVVVVRHAPATTGPAERSHLMHLVAAGFRPGRYPGSHRRLRRFFLLPCGRGGRGAGTSPATRCSMCS